MEDTGSPNITDKEQDVLDFLIELDKEGVHPTVRSGADRYQSSKFRAKRLTEDQFRGRVESLEAKGLVEQYEADGKQRYKPAA